MGLIDKIHTDMPFYGRIKITKQLQRDGYEVNEKRIRRLMCIMGISAIYPKPNFSKNDSEYKKFPYLLKGMSISKRNHVWGSDITYIKLSGGFMYLYAILDWYSRYVVGWGLSNTLETEFCLETLRESVMKYGKPEISNTDQGVQFTSTGYIDLMGVNEIKISMDGRGRCFDNIFTERLWRSVKYEEVYLKEYSNVKELKSSIDKYFTFYNHKRMHEKLGYMTPAEIYFDRS